MPEMSGNPTGIDLDWQLAFSGVLLLQTLLKCRNTVDKGELVRSRNLCL